MFNNDLANSLGQGKGEDAPYLETKDGKVIAFTPVKGRYIRLWSDGSSAGPGNEYSEVKVFGTKLMDDPYLIDNVALGKPISGSVALNNGEAAVDGRFFNDSYMSAGNGLQSVTVDLKRSYSLYKVILWHYFKDGRTYKDVIVQVSDDPAFSKGVVTVFNNDSDNTSGQGYGKDAVYAESSRGKVIAFPKVTGRYVRFWSAGSSLNGLNQYAEVKVYGSSLSSAPVNAAGLDSQGDNAKVPVLMYHAVREKPQGIYQISVKRFDEEMKYLHENGFTTLSMARYIAIMENKEQLPQKPILITFDDGWLDNYTIAVPILEKYGHKATFFVISNFIGKSDRISAEQLKNMRTRGFDIGSHALNHERLTDYNYAEQLRILTEARKKLDTALGERVNTFAYPYGALDTNTLCILEPLGFETSFSSYEGYSSKDDNSFTVRRLFVSGESSLDEFIGMLKRNTGDHSEK